LAQLILVTFSRFISNAIFVLIFDPSWMNLASEDDKMLAFVQVNQYNQRLKQW
jgi:predicted nicotinamide N-methyase